MHPAPRYHLETFGCQMNVHDSERMEGLLRAHGWALADGAADADMIVLNTCSVREKAEQKLRSHVGTLAPLKRARPDLVVVVAGCVAQQEGEKILARIPHVDVVLGPDNIGELPELALTQMAGAVPVVRAEFDVDSPRFLPASIDLSRAAPVSAFVTTMKGCDERCSFCVVPYTRGPERYRSVTEVIDEVRKWANAGSREVTLLGQTVDSYRDASLPVAEEDQGEGARPGDATQFPALLRAIAREVPELLRLRYTSPHPRHATAALARAHAELDLLARHVHLPVQSGSDRMLRRMIRRYTRAEYILRARRLQAARTDLTLSTDIIVGFPGETEADFAETLSLVREVGFVSLFAFKFSPRPHTPALRLEDDVPEEVKSERLARLFEVAGEVQTAHLAALVGTRQRVLVEGESKAEGRMQGRTERNEIVHIDGDVVAGELVEVVIHQAYKHSLLGKLAEPRDRPRPAARPAPARRALPLV